MPRPHYLVFARGQADALLLFIADQGKWASKRSCVSSRRPLARQPHDVDQHRAIDSALHLEIEEQATVAGQNRNAAQLALLLESPGRRNLFQSRPVLVLQHHAGGVVGDDPADDVRRHNDAKRRPVVFNDEGNVRPDRFDLLRVVVDDLIVRAIMRSTLAASMLP
jgi:hypothetical protein